VRIGRYMGSVVHKTSVRPRYGMLRAAVDETESETDAVHFLDYCATFRDVAYLKQFFATSFPLWLVDQIALITSLALCRYIGLHFLPEASLPLLNWSLVLVSASTVASWLCGLYPAVGITVERELRTTSLVLSIVFSGAVGHAIFFHASYPATVLLLGSGAFASILMPFGRRTARRCLGRFTWWSQPTLIYGGGESGKAIHRALTDDPQCGMRSIGIIDSYARHWDDAVPDTEAYLGPFSETTELIQKHEVFRAIVPLEEDGERDFAGRVNRAAGLFPHLTVTFAGWAPLARHTAGEQPLVGIPAIQIDEKLLIPLQRIAKRLLDLVILILVGPIVLPLIVVVATMIYVMSPGPVFFTQLRVGMGGKMFKVWKFRTMVVDAERVLRDHLSRDAKLCEEWNNFHKLRDDPRITPLGRLLRITSLDELPQLFNVFLGEMSFVGPRPYYEYDELCRFAPVIMRVRPGITGLWQISGRNRSTFEERLRIDAGYVRDWSPWLDLYILARTVKVVVTCDGAY
jgi:Undecaprenyl-phosphate galactose phosphotransferase WbaP